MFVNIIKLNVTRNFGLCTQIDVKYFSKTSPVCWYEYNKLINADKTYNHVT